MEGDLFGVLKFVSDKKDTTKEYKLRRGRHSFGCSLKADIRLLLKNFTESILCVIDVDENGFATLVKQSFRVPILVNYKEVKISQVLNHNDKIQIVNKHFVYINNSIQGKEIINADKSTINSKNKRRTTAASLSYNKSTSRIPVKQPSTHLRLSSSTSKVIDPGKGKPSKAIKKRLSLGDGPIKRPISTRNIQLDDNDKMEWEQNLSETVPNSKTPSKERSSTRRVSTRTPRPSTLPTISEAHQLEKDISVKNTEKQQTASNSGGSTSFIVEDLMVFSVNDGKNGNNSTSDNKNGISGIEDESMITFCTPENNTSTVIMENTLFESEKVTRKSKSLKRSIPLEVSTPKSIIPSNKSKKRGRESSSTVEKTLKKAKTSASISFVNKNLNFNKSRDYSNVDVIQSPIIPSKSCRSMSEPRNNRRCSRRFSLMINKFNFQSSKLINNDSMEGITILNESKDETTCLTTKSFYGSIKNIKDSSQFKRLSKCMTEPRKNRRSSMRRKSLVPIKFDLDVKNDKTDENLLHFDTNITKRKKIVNSTPTFGRQLSEKSRKSFSSEESISFLKGLSDDDENIELDDVNLHKSKDDRSSNVKSRKSIVESDGEHDELLKNNETFDVNQSRSLRSRRSSIKSSNSVIESDKKHDELSENNETFDANQSKSLKSRRSSVKSRKSIAEFNEEHSELLEHNETFDVNQSRSLRRRRSSIKSSKSVVESDRKQDELSGSNETFDANQSKSLKSRRSSVKSRKSIAEFNEEHSELSENNETLAANQNQSLRGRRSSIRLRNSSAESNQNQNKLFELDDSFDENESEQQKGFRSSMQNSVNSPNVSSDVESDGKISNKNKYGRPSKKSMEELSDSLNKSSNNEVNESSNIVELNFSNKRLRSSTKSNKSSVFEGHSETEEDSEMELNLSKKIRRLSTRKSLLSNNIDFETNNDSAFKSDSIVDSVNSLDISNESDNMSTYLNNLKENKSPKLLSKSMTEPKHDYTLRKTSKSLGAVKLNSIENQQSIKSDEMDKKQAKLPQNDLTEICSLRNSFSPNVNVSPVNDLSNVPNLRKVFSPYLNKSPKDDLINIKGLRPLFSSLMQINSPKNDLTDVKGVKKLMSTPKPVKSPKNDLSNVKGLSKMFNTPKAIKSPKNDLTNVKGLKPLFSSPKQVKSPKNDLGDVKGVKKLISTPKPVKSPQNDLSNIPTLKYLFNKEKHVQKSPENSLMDVSGVKQLFGVKKIVQFEQSNEVIMNYENNEIEVKRNTRKRKIVEEKNNKILNSPKRTTRRGKKELQEPDIQNETENDQEAELAKTTKRNRKGSNKADVDESPVVQETFTKQTNVEEKEEPKNKTRRRKEIIEENKITDSPKRVTRRGKKDVQDSDVESRIENNISIELEKPKRNTRRGNKVNVESPDVQEIYNQQTEENEEPKRKTRQKKVIEENKIIDSPKRATRRGKKDAHDSDVQNKTEIDVNIELDKPKRNTRRGKKMEVEKDSSIIQEIHTNQTNDEEFEEVKKTRQRKIVEEENEIIDSPKRVTRRGKKDAHDSDVQNKTEIDVRIELDKPKRNTRKGKKMEIGKDSSITQEIHTNQTNDDEFEEVKRKTRQRKVVEEENEIIDSPKRARRGKKVLQELDGENISENLRNDLEKPKRNKRKDKENEFENVEPLRRSKRNRTLAK